MVTNGELIAGLGLVNGMIGVTCLILPLLGMETGYLLIPLVAAFFGFISLYTCLLIIRHVGPCKNIRQAIMEHFDHQHWVSVVYNLIIGISLLGFNVGYFKFLVIQLEGFFEPSPFIGLSVFLIMFIITIVARYWNYSEKLLAIGVTGIFSYVIFVGWAMITAPPGDNTVPPTGPKFINMAAALTGAYAIHDFVVQVLVNTTTPDKYGRVVKGVYAIGVFVFTFIAMGAYAIANRKSRVDEPQTIEQFFPKNGWQVIIIRTVFMVHMLTAGPEYCVIMRQRFLQVCRIEQTRHITIPQLLVYLLAYGFCYFLYASGLKVATIIQINGSVIGFTYIFFIPIAVHIKCRYFRSHDEEGYMLVRSVAAARQEDNSFVEEDQNQSEPTEFVRSRCGCKIDEKNEFHRRFQLFLMGAIIMIGIISVVYTMYGLFFKKDEAGQKLL